MTHNITMQNKYRKGKKELFKMGQLGLAEKRHLGLVLMGFSAAQHPLLLF